MLTLQMWARFDDILHRKKNITIHEWEVTSQYISEKAGDIRSHS